MSTRIAREHERSLREPEAFWQEAARAIHWDKWPSQILDATNPPFYRWFRGGELNTCYNALDRHVEGGHAEVLALVYDSPVTGRVERYTYRQLRDWVAKFAGALAASGVERGDRVVLYMPVIREAVVAMLACARLGAVHSKEFPGFYKTADAGYLDDDGYIYVMARTDDIINVAGHRLSTGAMEEVLSSHPDVAECAVIGVSDELKGELPLGLLVLRDGAAKSPEQVASDVVQRVRDAIGPVASFKLATVVRRLPKTRSGKILRGTMKKIADGQPYKQPATIDDPTVLAEIEQALREIGFAKR